jgi:hypothetical protein
MPLLLHVLVGRVPLVAARLSQPPVIDASESDARLNSPPETELSLPVSVLVKPPVIEL